MNGYYTNISISGISSAVPGTTMECSDYIKVYGEKRIKKQVRLTGIEKIHVSKRYQKVSDLCYEAATKLLEHLKWDPKQIKILLLGTQSADYAVPATAIDLAARLGMGKDCLAFDYNLGCSAFDIGIQTAASLLQSQPEHSKAIVMVGDVVHHPTGYYKDATTIANSLMFGSGVGAVAIEKVEGSSISFANYSDGTGYDAIVRYHDGVLQMQGNKIFEYAINDVSDNIKAFLSENQLTDADIDGYIFHQAQKLIIDNIAASCNLPEEKVYISCDEYGNTDGASIPITICKNRDKYSDKDKIKVLSCGFGVGLSMAISYYTIDPVNILSISETDSHYDEHVKRHGPLYAKRILMLNPEDESMNTVIRELDRSAGTVDLVTDSGSESVVSQLFYGKESNVFDCLNDIPSQSGYYYHAVVSELKKEDTGKILKEIESLRQKEVIWSGSVFVFLANKKLFSKDELFDLVNTISNYKGQTTRVCVLTYDPVSMDFYPDIGDDLDWFRRRLNNSDTDAMVRAVYLSKLIQKVIEPGAVLMAKGFIDVSDDMTDFD